MNSSMNVNRFNLLLTAIAVACCFGCATGGRVGGNDGKVSYFDRNGDGKVDLEQHYYSGVQDADWQLRDDDFNGRYEKKILNGVGIIESVVDMPVPVNVRIQPENLILVSGFVKDRIGILAMSA